ncbi:MAG: helix-turn-helix transcriptional regulator [Spirochaetes bacterium]|nr:helix-turn-helix transcriptional regulator [Spirochaetota bacterium]
MPIPKPGSPVRGSKSGAPIMALFDLLGRRWAMGIIWQLSDGPLTFRAIQSKCNSMSPSVLNSRIKDLTEAMLIEQTPKGYALTKDGIELFEILQPFHDWSHKWEDKFESKK